MIEDIFFLIFHIFLGKKFCLICAFCVLYDHLGKYFWILPWFSDQKFVLIIMIFPILLYTHFSYFSQKFWGKNFIELSKFLAHLSWKCFKNFLCLLRFIMFFEFFLFFQNNCEQIFSYFLKIFWKEIFLVDNFVHVSIAFCTKIVDCVQTYIIF